MSIFTQITNKALKNNMGISGITDEFFSLSIKELYEENKKGILIVTPTLFEANKLYNYISSYLKNVYIFPADDFLTSKAVSVSKEYLAKRLEVLNKLINDDRQVVITHLEGYLKYLPNKKKYNDSIINLKIKDTIDIQKLVENIINLGYKREVLVSKTGDIGVRGFVLDIFLFEENNPVRIEFFGNEIESIRYFDVDTQKSIESINNIVIKPFLEENENNQNFVNISSYFNDKYIIYKDYNQIKNSYDRLLVDMLELNCKNNDAKLFELDKVFEQDSIHYLSFDSDIVDKKINFKKYDVKIIDSFNENIIKINEYIKEKINNKKTVIVALTKKQLNKLSKSLDKGYIFTDEDNIFENKVNLIDKNMNEGFVYDQYVFLSKNEIYNIRKEPHRTNNLLKYGQKIQNVSKLVVGDYIVHNIYGIGIYNGIKTLTKDGILKDYLEILYLKNDKLYIPVEKIDLIAKYSGNDGATPKINSLNGIEWAKTKQRIREKLKDISKEIITIQAKRKMAQGYKFSTDIPMQAMFEGEFMYELTPDQTKVTKEIKNDMESSFPMDRMLCGDVGYGKTEVAFRAIFKAICDSKQVLYLCPTTLLSQQIYDNAVERFKNYPIKIGLLNRFTTRKNQTKILNGLTTGEYDFVIGTHRLLSDDILLKDMGLLVIDEEQKFGVIHKEKIKKIATNIDILTLTATPIPRTLQMALLGLKDLSIIETPPSNRLPVQTYVIEENDYLIKNIIYKELSRNGQIFVLDNRVQHLEERYKKLKLLVPDAKITYAHGQMNSYDLEDCTYKFINGEYDVLLCTTIIENGIDIPNVNSLIVLDSDRLGLSQLYQIRGRVGRSDRLAYAYLMYNKNKVLTETAIKRLNVIKEYTDLGSGFNIANKDLMIRGAGDILGSEQAGFIDTVGIDLYFKMLTREILRLKGENIEEDEETEYVAPLINVKTHIEDEYVSESDLKIIIHKEINKVDSYETLMKIKSGLEDRFGKLDEYLINYMYEEWFEKLAKSLDVVDVIQKKEYIELVFSKEKSKEIDYQDVFIKSIKISNKFQFIYKSNIFHIKLLLQDLEKSPIYYLNNLLKEI